MEIRAYAEGDFAALTALWDATGISVDYNDPAKDIPLMLATPTCQLYVGVEEDAPVGSIMVGHEGHRGWLYKLAVSPKMQGKGLGRALVRQAELWLAARGLPKCNLLIRDTNLKVRDFYLKLGYEVAPRMVMQRWLKEVDLVAADLEIVTTYMEMTAPPTPPGIPRPVGQYAVMRLEHPTVPFYRYLYNLVGERWMWADRRRMGDAELEAAIHAEGVEIYVLYAGGEPAGYVELDRRPKPDIRIAYFGLAPAFIGRGLGRYLLNWAVDLAWSYGPERLLVSTWSFDHPRAFLNYQKAGFRPYKQERGRMRDPRLEGLIPMSVEARMPVGAQGGMSAPVITGPRLQRVADLDRKLIEVFIDGWQLTAMEGDTVLVAMLTQRGLLRQKQEGEMAGAGFCLMGACQDCWVWLEDGRRVRACSSYVEPGLRVRTTCPPSLLGS